MNPLKHIPALDGIRGIAIVLVMSRHFAEPFLDRGPDVALGGIAAIDRIFYRICSLGSVGVDLFFVLSGFLITGILLESKASPNYFRRFYWRRTLRIFPLYYAALIACFVVYPMVWGNDWSIVIHRARDEQIWYWLYCENVLFAIDERYYGLAHFWSLAVEEQFYLVWPVVVLAVPARHMLTACGVCVLGAFAFRAQFALRDTSIIVPYVSTICRMDSLAVGAAIAVIARTPGALNQIRRPALGIAIASVLALAVAIYLLPQAHGSGGRTILLNLFGVTAVSVFFGGILVAALTAQAGSMVTSTLESRFLCLFGKYSYCLYVVHPFVWGWLITRWDDSRFPVIGGSLLLGRLVFFLIATIGSLGFAMVSWRVLEQPFLRLKDRYKP